MPNQNKIGHVEKIKFNREIHDKISGQYENRHDDIFNPIEQNRLRQMLEQSMNFVKTELSECRALDYGCGSGNLTRHLVEMGLHVLAADVSPEFLKAIQRKYGSSGRVSTKLINGHDLADIPDNSFDLVATYSVLHHVPDYLNIVKELCRVCKAGGVIYIDHEHNDAFFDHSSAYSEFRKAVAPTPAVRIQGYLRLLFSPSFYVRFVRKRINSRYSSEGDIHVWPDDHIQWNAMEQLIGENGFEIVLEHEYLAFSGLYPKPVYDQYADKCSDMKMLVAQKVSER